MKLFLKCGGILFAITLFMGGLLGYVNNLTTPVIAELAAQKRTESMNSVLEGKITGGEIKHEPDGETCVEEIVELETDKGVAYAVTAAPRGYGGEIKLMIGLDENAVVTGVEIMEISETPGLGARAKDEKFTSQFKGENPEIHALTGATITTNAVKRGVSEAITQVKHIGKD